MKHSYLKKIRPSIWYIASYDEYGDLVKIEYCYSSAIVVKAKWLQSWGYDCRGNFDDHVRLWERLPGNRYFPE